MVLVEGSVTMVNAKSFFVLLCSSTLACAGDEPMSTDGAPMSMGPGVTTSTSAGEGSTAGPGPTTTPAESGETTDPTDPTGSSDTTDGSAPRPPAVRA